MNKPLFQTASTLALATALSGCAIHSTEQALTLEATGHVMIAAEAAERYDINGNWWEIYQSPQLNALIAQALADNIELKQAAVSVNKALYEANIAGADLLPGASGLLSASTSKNLKTGDKSNNFGSRLELSYELDLWRKLSAAADSRVWEYQATQQDLANTRLTLANSVANAYFNIAYLNEAIELTKKTVKQYQEIVRIADAKFRHGRVDSSQPTQSAQSLLSAQNSLLALQNSRDAQIQTLRNLLNLKPGQNPAADPASYRLPKTAGVNLDVPITVLANRPDLRAAEYRVQSALQTLNVQKRSWYPSITLGATLSTSSDKARSAFNIPLLGGSVGISLPFLNWQTMKWKDKSAKADFDKAKLSFEQTLTTALNEVHTHYLAYQNARATLANQEQRLALERKNSRYYQLRYQHGKNELKDWLEALNSEYAAAQNVLNQRYETLKSESTTYKAMAGRYTPK